MIHFLLCYNTDMPRPKKQNQNESNRRAVALYHSKLDTIAVRIPKGQKDHYKAAAAAAGMSLNQFAVSAMDEKIDRDDLDLEE